MVNKIELVRITDVQLDELEGYLLGSSMMLDEGLDSIGLDFDQLHPDSFSAIDARIFRCDSCGWWYEVQADAGNNTCFCCAVDDGGGLIEGIDEPDEDEYIEYEEDDIEEI